MKRRQFVSLAAITVLAGCNGADTVGSNPTDGTTTNGTTADRESDELSGISQDGLEDVGAVLDAHESTLDETSHTLKLTITAEDTFEDGFKASESRAYHDPAANQLHYRNWWRYPDGDRAEETEIYADSSAAGKRTVRTEGDDRLESLSTSAARREYARARENIQGLVSMFEYGSLEETSDGYELQVSGVSDTAGDNGIQGVGSGTLRIADSGVVQSFTVTDVREQLDTERYYDVTFEVTDVGETSVSEPGWFSDIADATTDGDSTADGNDGGDDYEEDEGGTTETRDGSGTTETLDDVGDATEILVGPGGDLVFDPETVTIAPGDTVVWTWKSNGHNVAPENIPEEADWEGHPEISDDGTRYSHTFEVEGEYIYICEPHVMAGMEGEIMVE